VKISHVPISVRVVVLLDPTTRLLGMEGVLDAKEADHHGYEEHDDFGFDGKVLYPKCKVGRCRFKPRTLKAPVYAQISLRLWVRWQGALPKVQGGVVQLEKPTLQSSIVYVVIVLRISSSEALHTVSINSPPPSFQADRL